MTNNNQVAFNEDLPRAGSALYNLNLNIKD